MDYEKPLALGVMALYAFGFLGIFPGSLMRLHLLKQTVTVLTLAGFGLHTLLIVLTLATNSLAEFSTANLVQFLAWCLIFLYLIVWRILRYPFLGLTAAPLALLLFILSLRLSNVQNVLPEHLSGLFFGLHIWTLYLSIAFLTTAFAAGLFFIFMEGKLKKKSRLTDFMRDMPSLAACDKVNMAAAVAGFPLYTLGLMSGFIWAPMHPQLMENPKVLLSLLVWFLYALLFYQRTALGLRGRKPALIAIFTFCISVLSFATDYTLSHHSVQFLP